MEHTVEVLGLLDFMSTQVSKKVEDIFYLIDCGDEVRKMTLIQNETYRQLYLISR